MLRKASTLQTSWWRCIMTSNTKEEVCLCYTKIRPGNGSALQTVNQVKDN